MTNPFNTPNDGENPTNNPAENAGNESVPQQQFPQGSTPRPESGAYPEYPQYPGTEPAAAPQDPHLTAQTPSVAPQSGYPAYGAAPDQQLAPAGGWAIANQARNAWSPWALGLGIAALVCSGFLWIIGLGVILGPILGIIAVILAIIALVKGKNYEGPGKRKGQAIAGLVTGALALLIGVGFFVAGMAFISEWDQQCGHLSGPEQEQCIMDMFNA